MTHMLPRVMIAVKPWLHKHVTDPRFWDDEYDTAHTGDYALPEPTADDRAEMFERYKAQPNPLKDKSVVAVQV